MRARLLVMLALFLIPLAYGIECQRVTQPKDIPCTLISTWKPVTGCTVNITYYTDSGVNILNTSWEESIPFCNSTFNITVDGIYIYNSTIEDGVIVVQSEDNMTSLGIILFLLLLNGTLFFLPFRINLSKNKPTNFVMKNMMFVLGWVLLAFNTTILATLADNAGLGITHELFVFQWFFLKGIYVLALIVFIRTMLLVPKLLKEQRAADRMGNYEG